MEEGGFVFGLSLLLLRKFAFLERVFNTRRSALWNAQPPQSAIGMIAKKGGDTLGGRHLRAAGHHHIK